MRPFRNIRVIPVAVLAVCSLAVLKVAGLVIDGGYVFDYGSPAAASPALSTPSSSSLASSLPASSPPSWAQENFNYPGRAKDVLPPTKGDPADVTGSVHGAPAEAPKQEKPKPEAPDTRPEGTVYHPEDTTPPVSPSERAILERLQSRRQELDARAREIDIRESLLKEAERRIGSKVEELKAVEAKDGRDKEQKAETDGARFKGIVTMYEGMKPKDAAKVFDRLEMPVLIEIASQIAPRKMSDILGLMQPEAAERLTVELARRANGDKSSGASAELPKIEGKVLAPR